MGKDAKGGQTLSRCLLLLPVNRRISSQEVNLESPARRAPAQNPYNSNSAKSISDDEFGFALADELEKGLGDNMSVLSTSVRTPVSQGKKLHRCNIFYKDSSDEFQLLTEEGDLLITAREVAQEERIEFFIPEGLTSESLEGMETSSNMPIRERRPFFAMNFNRDKNEWILIKTQCELCVHRPKLRTCEYIGKGQQAARIRHSRCNVGKAKVHHVHMHLPPLTEKNEIKVWCPISMGRDLGQKSVSTHAGYTTPPRERSQGAVKFMLEEDTELISLHTRLPEWDDEVESLVLNFKKRSVESSPRNFMLCDADQNGSIVLQHAKLSQNTWCLDFSFPLSTVQAFSVAMSSLTWE